jgi:hypothetical protein
MLMIGSKKPILHGHELLAERSILFIGLPMQDVQLDFEPLQV